MGAATRFEAYCDHCHAGVLSRDSLVSVRGERLCFRCCAAREEKEEFVRRISGWLLMGCAVVGAGTGYAIARLWGLLPGAVAGFAIAGIVERQLKRF